MIKIFGTNDTSFDSNGDVVISPLKAKVYKQDNGDYYLDFECGLQYVDLITEDRIIVANTPTGEQAFRIKNPIKQKNKVTAKANHVFFDTKNLIIADTDIVDKNCNEAMVQLNSHTDITSPFTTYSNIDATESYRCIQQNMHDALATVLEQWGGHLVRNNFSIQILENIGQDNGVTVRYGKNLQDINCEENWTDVATKILPVGRDGILLNDLDPSQSIYMESDTQYSVPYTKVVTFNQEIDNNDYPSIIAYRQALVNDLRAQAQAYLEQNCCPLVNYTLKAHLDNITDIGDVIEVIDDRLGITITTQVIAFTYDCILEKYTEIEFGNFQKTLSDLIGTISAQVNQNRMSDIQEATDSIWQTLNKSYVIFDGYQILIVDELPKENATNVIKIDSDGIKFGTDGILGQFTTSWAIDGTFKPKNNEELADYIVSEGSNNTWSWTKYSSGACDLWGKVSIDSSLLTWSAFALSLIHI